jgi:hypothetical protein
VRSVRRPLALAASALMLQLAAGTTHADPVGHLAMQATLPERTGLAGWSWRFDAGPALPAEPDDGKPVPIRYQWQLRHRWKPLMDFGLQGFGAVGVWHRWPADRLRSHQAGPALFGHWDLGRGGDQALLYQAAYLLGRVYGRQGDLFTVRLQYRF